MPIKLTDIDLSKPLKPIYIAPGYNEVRALVSWGYRPLGQLRLYPQPNQRTLSVDQLHKELLAAFGWEVWVQVAVEKMIAPGSADQALPPISVIVCTRDRPHSLERCLEALAALDYPSYEVVVVDNCSKNPEVARVVARSGFRYAREERPGLDWARNRGAQEARHEIIAYVDDDALAAPGWLRGIAQGFADPEVMAVTGMVLPAELETPAQYDFEVYGGMCKGFTSFTVRRDELGTFERFWASRWGVGANMAFRRELFDAVGTFDVALDVGTPSSGGGDIEFFYRVVSHGHTLRYEPAALVKHIHRRDQASLNRQIYNNGRSFGAYLLTIMRNEPWSRPAALWFALRWWIWPWLLRRLLGSIRAKDRWTLRFALVEFWGSCSAIWAYQQSQRAAAEQRELRKPPTPGVAAISGA
jgi:glycosyltransferase involved in cell wall biosynthesis